jgi:3-methyladenine DNA glycosylase AlkD
MTLKEVLKELEEFGEDQTKSTYKKHGAKEPVFGVKVADLKKILKKSKKNHELALALYDTGNSDAMYLAGLMAEEKRITRSQLEDWVNKAYWYYLSEYTVPWVASETPFGFELGLKWINSDKEMIAAAGWATLASYAGVNPDANLNIEQYSQLLDKVERTIGNAQNRVKYTMNGFVIAIGIYLKDLTEKSIIIANKIGKVEVNLGSSSCKVPIATDYINIAIEKGKIGKKRKSARC